MSQNEKGSEQIVSSEPKKSSGEEYEESINKNLKKQNLNNEENNENNQQKENEQLPSEKNEIGESQNNAQPENKYDYEQNKKEIMEKIEIRKQQADLVEKYIYETGIGTSFQIIFSELITKKIPVENYYTYTASRLRQIGREKEALDRKNNKNK